MRSAFLLRPKLHHNQFEAAFSRQPFNMSSGTKPNPPFVPRCIEQGCLLKDSL